MYDISLSIYHKQTSSIIFNFYRIPVKSTKCKENRKESMDALDFWATMHNQVQLGTPTPGKQGQVTDKSLEESIRSFPE
jgi:hypothetical protein